MLDRLRAARGPQIGVGFGLGALFGFLLDKSGVTRFDVIAGQLLLEDFTVLKVMMTAALVGMIGVYGMRARGWARLHPKPGSWGATGLGGLLFGVGFALLGYCPGTVAGAVGHGALDALFGGAVGMLIGSGLFAALYPAIRARVLERGAFPALTLPELLGAPPRLVVPAAAAVLAALLVAIEWAGL
ncbi:MAG: YeeE/YedE family protein [Candidatus Eisenbacteria bacterium]|nr:YeeE/YedE family protein [Candidatus Eisenbacteria bacterium]